jgi:hypothetical protein
VLGKLQRNWSDLKRAVEAAESGQNVAVRKIWSSLLLAFCLVFSQQGALLHELSHFSQRSPVAGVTEVASKAAGTSCDICVAFDQIAGVVSCSSCPAILLASEDHWEVTESFSVLASEVPASRARDPPFFL